MLGKFEFRTQQLGVWIDEGGTIVFQQFGRRKRTVKFGQLRFVVKEFEVAGCTAHKKKDHPLGFGNQGWLFGRQRVDRLVARGKSQASLGKKMAEGNSPQPHGAPMQEPAPRHILRFRATIEMLLAIHSCSFRTTIPW